MGERKGEEKGEKPDEVTISGMDTLKVKRELYDAVVASLNQSGSLSTDIEKIAKENNCQVFLVRRIREHEAKRQKASKRKNESAR